MLLIIDASNISSICCIDAPVVSQGVQSLLNASAGISREIETSCNVLQVRMYECAQVLQSAGQMIDAVQTVTRTVTSSVWQTTHLVQNDVVNNPLISQTLSGSTTTDESAASASRLQSAATQQDLQSAATAPQLTTTQDPVPATDPAIPAEMGHTSNKIKSATPSQATWSGGLSS